MYLDLHSHSVSSDDSRSTVEQYLKWIQVLRKRGHTVDGIVLTEHRKFDFGQDYSGLSRCYDVLVFKGSELDTRHGHFLVYGVTKGLTRDIDFADVKMDAREMMRAAAHHGALAVPAHPGRFGIGLADYIDQGEAFDDVRIVELLNGGSRKGENERAAQLCAKFGYRGIGGSDAHLTSHVGTCMTWFEDTISSEQELVKALLGGLYEPVWLEPSANGVAQPGGPSRMKENSA